MKPDQTAQPNSPQDELTVSEQLILLLHKEDEGSIVALSNNWQLSCGFIGAILLDLSFKNRVDTDIEGVRLVDESPTGDELLDPTLLKIRQEKQVRTPRYWIEHLAPTAEQYIDDVLERLLERGILEQDSAGFWTLSDAALDDSSGLTAHQKEIKKRIRRVVLEDEIPDPHEVTLMALLHSFDGFKTMLSVDELESASERIELLIGLDLFGRAIVAAVTSLYQPPTSMMIGRGMNIPQVGLLDCLKSKTMRSLNLPKFFAEKIEEIGPVFELKLGSTKFIVLGGQSANKWASRRGRVYLRSQDYIEDFQHAWGTARSIASMDGAEHFRMRKVYRSGTSRTRIEHRLDEVFEIGRECLEDWKDGEVLPGELVCQRFTGKQVATLMVSINPPYEILDGLIEYEFRALKIYVMGILPKFLLKTPKMKRALKSVIDLYQEIHTTHTPGQRENLPADLVDDLFALHQTDPTFLPATDLEFSFIAPLIAGHYMGSAVNFALYELLANPSCMEKVTQEADALFANGDPTMDELTMESIDFTHRFVMEVLRIHPVIPVHLRTAMNSFQFDQYRIPERSQVMLAYPATHFMGTLFKDPEKFDPDRFAPPREEHRTPNAYFPFGLGTHMCLGARFAEFNMVTTLLLITHHFELEMVPKSYKLKLSPIPKFSPNKKFKFRVKKVRHNLP